jgi:hypothetical protein
MEIRVTQNAVFVDWLVYYLVYWIYGVVKNLPILFNSHHSGLWLFWISEVTLLPLIDTSNTSSLKLSLILLEFSLEILLLSDLLGDLALVDLLGSALSDNLTSEDVLGMDRLLNVLRWRWRW